MRIKIFKNLIFTVTLALSAQVLNAEPLACIAVYPCTEDGGVKEEHQGPCRAIYEAQCKSSQLTEIKAELKECNADLDETQEFLVNLLDEYKELEAAHKKSSKQLKRIRRRMRAARK